jgi:hypothetical protein
MAVGKALAVAAAGGKATPHTLLARLCVGVVQLLDQCLTVLKSKVRQYILQSTDTTTAMLAVSVPAL